MTSIGPHSCWCFDERAAHRAHLETVEPVDPANKADGWPHLFAAVLDALLPFREAYAAAIQVAQDALAQIPRHPLPGPL